jgi:two-component system cell cycle sensor histidine kinase/response regulator CckA
MNGSDTVTILLCDDDEVIRELYRKILELRGYRVITAVDGNDAIEKYKEKKDEISLLVSDVMMPNKSGGQAYEEIRKINKSLRVIFSSGYNTETTRTIKEEGYHYLQKPYAPQLLLQKIKEVLDEDRHLDK